jgi:hypothetical protein
VKLQVNAQVTPTGYKAQTYNVTVGGAIMDGRRCVDSCVERYGVPLNEVIKVVADCSSEVTVALLGMAADGGGHA